MKLRLYALLFFLLSSFSCTRDLQGLGLSVGLGGQGTGGLAADDQLTKTVTVLHLPGQPALLRETLYKKGDVPRGQDLSIDLNKVPIGTKYLIQFLAIYVNSNSGALRYFYGSSVGVVQPSLTIDITAEDIAESDRLIRASGRFFSGNGSAPSGNLQIEYHPRGEPAVPVEIAVVEDGWFSVLVPQAKVGSLSVRLGAELVFPRLNADADEFANLNVQRLKIVKPLSFFLGPGGETAPHPEVDLYLGLWGNSLGKVCYPEASEVVAGEFANPGLSLPLEFATMTPTTQQIRPAGGGEPVSGHPADCTLLFDPQRVASTFPFYR